MKAKVQ
jgi:hypothetical protein